MCEQFSQSPSTSYASTHHSHDSLTFLGLSSFPALTPTLIARGQIDSCCCYFLSLGTTLTLQSQVPIEGGWGFPQLERRKQVGLHIPLYPQTGAKMEILCTEKDHIQSANIGQHPGVQYLSNRALSSFIQLNPVLNRNKTESFIYLNHWHKRSIVGCSDCRILILCLCLQSESPADFPQLFFCLELQVHFG